MIGQRRLRMLSPVGTTISKTSRLAPVLKDVRGKAAGFRIQWSSFGIFMERFEELLRERYKPSTVHVMDQRWESTGISAAKHLRESRANRDVWQKEYDDFAKQSDWAVVGLAA